MKPNENQFSIQNEHQNNNLKKINHIGIAVKSIEESLNFYQNHLGLKLEGIETVKEELVKVAFLKIGETRIELLEPINDDSTISKFINKKGEGIHHIALEVDNLSDRIKDLKEKGINFIYDDIKKGAKNANINFIHPKLSKGVLYELIEE